MAKDYKIVKSMLTVFVQDLSIGTFDPSLAYAVAVAQSYTLDETGDTQEVVDLCSDQADWQNPEVNLKSWTLTADTLLLRPVTSGTGTQDITGKKNIYDLEIGDEVWCVIGDASACSLPGGSLLKYKYGIGLITSLSQGGSVQEFQTLSATFTGKGPLYRQT